MSVADQVKRLENTIEDLIRERNNLQEDLAVARADLNEEKANCKYWKESSRNKDTRMDELYTEVGHLKDALDRRKAQAEKFLDSALAVVNASFGTSGDIYAKVRNAAIKEAFTRTIQESKPDHYHNPVFCWSKSLW